MPKSTREGPAALVTFSLQSGSNGNSIYVEVGGVRLLIDAGISAQKANMRLSDYGRRMSDVDALLISHDHNDHIRAAGVYQRKFGMPIYATAATFGSVRHLLGKVREVRHFRAGETFSIRDVEIHTLSTPHDAVDGVVFVIEHNGKRLGVLTDLGHPFRGLGELLASLDAVYLESNYDPEMLANGPYSWDLQERIRGEGGHISNAEAAELLQSSANGRLQWAALAHLSETNNHPDVALATHREILGDRYPLVVAGRDRVSKMLHV